MTNEARSPFGFRISCFGFSTRGRRALAITPVSARFSPIGQANRMGRYMEVAVKRTSTWLAYGILNSALTIGILGIGGCADMVTMSASAHDRGMEQFKQ